MKLLMAGLVFAVTLSMQAGTAAAECNCVSVAAEVSASVQAEVARADSLYAAGDFDGALSIYADAYAESGDAALLYAQAMAQWNLGAADDAEASFAAYLEAGGNLMHRDQAEAALGDVKAGVSAAVGGVVGGAVGAGGSLSGQLRKTAAKPKKVAKGAAIVLAVVAVATVGAVAVHGIAAGLDDDVDATFDKKFGIGMGLSGVVVGATAIYLYGLTAATGAVGGACAADTRHKPVVVPVAYRGGGGGLAAALTF